MPDPGPSPSDPADADWSRVFADLSHDVRSITGGALMSLDAFVLTRSEADREKTMAMLRSSLRRFVRLADDLRDVADVLAVSPRPSGVAHDLLLAVRRACDRLAGEAGLRHVEIELEAAGIAAHVVTGDPEAWDRTLERLLECGLQRVARNSRLVVTLVPRPPRLELVVPCGSLELPADDPLRAAWAAPRDESGMFARGLWLARNFLADQGGELAIREEEGRRLLVATLPAS